jgi:excisionase family DNA binding protein
MSTLSLSLDEGDVRRIAEAVAHLLLDAQRSRTDFKPEAARLTVAEAARELRCHERTVRALIDRRLLRAAQVKKGGRLLIARSEIERFLREAGEP